MNAQDTKTWRADIEAMKSQTENSKATLTQEQTVAELELILDRYEWFHSAAIDEYKRVVVYVNDMTPDNLRIVPDTLCGHKIFFAFSSFLLCREKYGTGGSGKSVLKQYAQDE